MATAVLPLRSAQVSARDSGGTPQQYRGERVVTSLSSLAFSTNAFRAATTVPR